VNGEGRGARYHISSRRGSARTFLGATRKHWGIESGCHWVLDAAFREDDHRLREGHAPENVSPVQKMALAVSKKAKANTGIKNKRLRAGRDETLLEHVLRDFPGK
jgi:predicted transposase YbfD/YdcC